ncbi:hypothetical protein JXA63_01325 [Candidatus Woesebacteria bacterium]|nr:hypothetical protein [Candidatus Woesebacteria bacterium]
MRKKLPIFLLVCGVLLFTICTNINVNAQSVELSDFDKALQTYLNSVEDYKKEHADYVLAKSQYERYQTLSSQNAAFEETLQMLEARDQVIIDYLISLKEKILMTPSLEENMIDEAIAKLDQSIGWFSDHKTRLPSAGNLQDLSEDSTTASEKYVELMPLIYESLSLPAYGLVTDYESRLENLHTGLKDKLDKINKEEREEYQLNNNKLQLMDKWLLESELRFVRSEEKRVMARQLINDLSNLKKVDYRSFENIITRILESRQHLKDSLNFMNEILREIKTTE